MLVHRLRRWPSISPALFSHLNGWRMRYHVHTNVKYNLYVFINAVYHYFYTVCIYRVIMSTRKNTKLTIGDGVTPFEDQSKKIYSISE